MQPAVAQEKEIVGQVTDTKGIPLPGVNIIEKGTNNGTATDFNGIFELTVSNSDAILEISYVSFTTQEIPVGSKSKFNIMMEGSADALDEVVVVGYGTQKKSDLTGAVSQIKMDDVLKSRPVTSLGSALQGTMSGFTSSTSNVPGGDNSFNIRGMTSINGGTPLVLVDNTVMENLKLLNLNDIESITVLKDASAAAIYGARASAGVVLITTKKGSSNQKPSISYTSNFSVSNPINILEAASPIETVTALKDMGYDAYWSGQNIDLWLNLLNEYNTDPSTYPLGWTEEDGTKYFLKETNVVEDMFETSGGFKSIHNLSIVGGSEKSNYRISFGQLNEDGVLITDKDSYKRTNVSSYVSSDITPWLTTSLDAKYASDNRGYPNTGTFGLFLTNYPSYHPEGTIPYQGEDYPVQTPENAIKYGNKQTWKNSNIRLFSHTEIKPIKDLKITFDYSYQQNNQKNRKYNNYFLLQQGLQDALNPSDQNTTFYLANELRTYKTINLFANYNKSFNDVHNFESVIGFNQEERNFESHWSRSFLQISNEQPSLGGTTGATPPETDDAYDTYTLRGAFGRLSYNYKEKYLASLNGRYDLSSKFPEGYRGGFFPSFSAGWVISKESFFKPLKNVMSFFKVRGSFGSLGNQNIGNYGFLATMNPFNANWINNSQQPTSLSTPGLVRSNYTWEKVESLNGGVDFGVFNNQLTGAFEVFKRETKGMLAPGLDLPAVAGAPAPLQNAADLKSTGWELTLNWKDRVSETLSYGLGMVISDSKAVITKYRNENNALLIGGSGGLNNYYVGMGIGEIWGYETDGFYTAEDFNSDGTLKDDVVSINGVISHEGDIKYKNLSDSESSINTIDAGENTLENSGDRRIIGNTTPRYNFGFNGFLDYKNFNLSFMLQGVAKRDLWVGGDVMFPHSGYFSTLQSHQLDYWTPENTDAYYGRIYANAQEAHGVNQRVQTKFLQDASYLRVKNITLSYNLPKNIIEKLGLGQVSIFYSGENLFTFTNLVPGVDPESTSWSYPNYTTSAVGVNVNF
ncbi:SusC/RagA family TonB-linked outer membrane protein [Salegentibacter maritimus]|uniref:SusC/RagA family TonB-linked outer membrane protein n=1 Tax=Salegentibacter maritimus TaxID=2794347 RepID=UPI0018E489F8|nr:TonB-dependent receptor [Salegentibacter maritimus]MBI6116810.1 TonB-dependent receptor [Salegentibacter maritimus]